MVLETEPDFQRNPAKLQDIYVRSTLAPSTLTTAGTATAVSAAVAATATTSATTAASGSAVPLSAFTHLESTTAPLSVNHQGQFPVVTISFNLAPGASLGAATQAIERAQKSLQDAGVSIQSAFQGAAASFQASLAGTSRSSSSPRSSPSTS